MTYPIGSSDGCIGYEVWLDFRPSISTTMHCYCIIDVVTFWRSSFPHDASGGLDSLHPYILDPVRATAVIHKLRNLLDGTKISHHTLLKIFLAKYSGAMVTYLDATTNNVANADCRQCHTIFQEARSDYEACLPAKARDSSCVSVLDREVSGGTGAGSDDEQIQNTVKNLPGRIRAIMLTLIHIPTLKPLSCRHKCEIIDCVTAWFLTLQNLQCALCGGGVHHRHEVRAIDAEFSCAAQGPDASENLLELVKQYSFVPAQDVQDCVDYAGADRFESDTRRHRGK